MSWLKTSGYMCPTCGGVQLQPPRDPHRQGAGDHPVADALALVALVEAARDALDAGDVSSPAVDAVLDFTASHVNPERLAFALAVLVADHVTSPGGRALLPDMDAVRGLLGELRARE